MTKQERFDIHQHITDQIVAAIERGAGEFRLPWHRSAGNIMRPVNVASKKAYRGVNILALWATAEEKGYASGTWGTYRQWAEIGAQVRKGEKAAFIVFYKELEYARRVRETATGRRRPASSRALRQCSRPSRSTVIRPLRSTRRRRLSLRRSSRPRPLSPRPVLQSATAAAGLSIVPRPTASSCRRAKRSSAPRPARRQRRFIPPSVMN